MNKLNLNINNSYVLEVNDKGDTIELDFEDIEFIEGLNDMYSGIMRATKVMEDSVEKITKQPAKEVEGSLLNSQELSILEAMNAYYQKGRKAIDLAFGDGASYKIFGNKNRYFMFFDFFDAIDPHLEQAGVKLEERIEDVRKKYTVKKEDKTVI